MPYQLYCLSNELSPCGWAGLGAGGNPMVGQQAALESKDEILDMVQNTDLVFVTAGTSTLTLPVFEIHLQRGSLIIVCRYGRRHRFRGRADHRRVR